jgi:hypothetical protein
MITQEGTPPTARICIHGSGSVFLRKPHLRQAITPGAGFRIVFLDEINQRFQRHFLLHVAPKMLPLSAPFGCGLLAITEAELFASNQPILDRQLPEYFAWIGCFYRVSLAQLSLSFSV